MKERGIVKKVYRDWKSKGVKIKAQNSMAKTKTCLLAFDWLWRRISFVVLRFTPVDLHLRKLFLNEYAQEKKGRDEQVVCIYPCIMHVDTMSLHRSQ